MTEQTSLEHLTLGKSVSYVDTYEPKLLQAVPRAMNRQALQIVEQQPFYGWDIWNGYELSWLNLKGKPCVGLLTATIHADSVNLVESKSFKLYLNSFNQSRFSSTSEVAKLIEKDLQQCAQGQVTVSIHPLSEPQFNVAQLSGTCIDDIDLEITQYQPDASVLTCIDNKETSETLHSHLLKSNCLITHQPDWASIQIDYQGTQIDHASLLKYLISFRQHNEFHEQCVERIFCDLMTYCEPQKLSVYARYTRRGGLDINPFRSNFQSMPQNVRLSRQ